MKFIIVALAFFFGILIVLVIGILYGQVKAPTQPFLGPHVVAATSTTPAAATTSQPFAPTVFHGPTAQPRIKGPTANPPNY